MGNSRRDDVDDPHLGHGGELPVHLRGHEPEPRHPHQRLTVPAPVADIVAEITILSEITTSPSTLSLSELGQLKTTHKLQ